MIGVALKVAHLDDALDTGASDWDLETFKTATDALDRLTDFRLLRLEQEHDRLMNRGDNTPGGLPKSELDAIVARMEEIQQEVARTIAVTPAGVAAKLRLLHHGFESLKTVWGEQGWDSCLASLVNMGGIPTPAAQVSMPNGGAAKRHIDNRPDPDENIIRLWRERGSLTAEADEIIALAPDDPDAEKRADVLDGKATEIEKRIAIMTPNGPSGWAVQVALMALWHERGNRADHLDQHLIERLGTYFLGTISRLPDVAGSGENPDAALFALEVEMKAAHEGLAAAVAATPNNDDAHQPWYDRMIAAEETAQAIPAQTAVGVLAKVRMAAWYQNPKPSRDSEAHEFWLRNIVADAVRLAGIGGAS